MLYTWNLYNKIIKGKGKRGSQAPIVHRNKNHRQENKILNKEKEERILLYPRNQNMKNAPVAQCLQDPAESTAPRPARAPTPATQLLRAHLTIYLFPPPLPLFSLRGTGEICDSVSPQLPFLI